MTPRGDINLENGYPSRRLHLILRIIEFLGNVPFIWREEMPKRWFCTKSEHLDGE